MAQEPPRGYWVARVDAEDPAAYDRYRALNAKAFAAFGGRFLLRGPAAKVAMGAARRHNVVIEFESLAKAAACYESPEYQAALVHLKDVGAVDLVIVEGYDGPQP